MAQHVKCYGLKRTESSGNFYWEYGMIEEEFHGYRLKAWPMETRTKKYTVCVIIERETEGLNHREQFTAHDGIEYILEIEAAKESLNLGRNLIKAKLTGF